jgi:L-alanine-DL-glutamate epimerase-like enolase superfamily enzyme
MADDKKTPATLSLDAAKRMGEATEFYEQNYREEPLPMARGPRAMATLVRLAKTTGTISAMAGSTAGTGNIELYTVAENGAVTASGVTTTVFNVGGSVATGKFVLVSTGPWGWWLVVVAC